MAGFPPVQSEQHQFIDGHNDDTNELVLDCRAPIKYAELTDMYGPVFSFKQGKNIVCVIGRYQVGDCAHVRRKLKDDANAGEPFRPQ